MSKRVKKNPGQLRLAFPPEMQQELIDSWRRLKRAYPGFLLFVVVSGHYVTLDQDADILHSLTGRAIADDPVLHCMFPLDNESVVFAALAQHGYNLAVCDPPDDPSRFVFT